MANNAIPLTYLNIRQSITILLTKLIVIDLLLACVIVGLYFMLVQGETFLFFASRDTVIFLSIFGFFGILKMFFTSYIILEWLNEYYEITPEDIRHKSGVIFRKTEDYKLDLVRVMEVNDSALGEIFNFGTITLYDIRLEKYLDLYLIHNPRRYAKVLQQLCPAIEVKTQDVRLPSFRLRKGEL